MGDGSFVLSIATTFERSAVSIMFGCPNHLTGSCVASWSFRLFMSSFEMYNYTAGWATIGECMKQRFETPINQKHLYTINYIPSVKCNAEREGEKERREEWERQSVERGQSIEIHFELLLSDSDVIRNNSQTDNKCLRCGPCVSCLYADLNIRFDQIVYYTNIDIRNATERSSSSNSSKFHDAAFSLGEFRKFQSQSRSFTLSISPYMHVSNHLCSYICEYVHKYRGISIATVALSGLM